MKSMANSVELIIHTKVWLYDEVEQDDEACKENNDPVAQVDQDHENTEKSESIIENSVETMKQPAVKYMNIIGEHLEELANWSDIKEKVDWGVHNF